MRRTRPRPLPDGRVAPADARDLRHARCRVAGLVLLAARANWSAGRSRARDARRLPGRLHADEAPHAVLDARRRGAGRAAAAHRLDGVARQRRSRRRRALRDRVPVADSAFHGDRVAVSRRLRQGRLPDAAGHRPGGPARGTPGAAVRDRARAREPGAGTRSASPGRSIWRSRWCSASRCSCSPSALPGGADDADGARAVLRIDHLSAAALDRDDRGQGDNDRYW